MISMQLCGHRKAAMAAMSEWIDRRHCRRLRHCLGHRKLGRRLAAMTPAGTPRGDISLEGLGPISGPMSRSVSKLRLSLASSALSNAERSTPDWADHSPKR